MLQCFAYYKLCIFIQCVSQTTIKWATSALSTVRHQKRDFGLAKMTKWSARWPLIVRRVPSKGREFKPQPGRSGGQYPIWWISRPVIYIYMYIYQKINVTNINIDHGMFRYAPYFCHFPMIHFKNKINRKWKSFKEEMT